MYTQVALATCPVTRFSVPRVERSCFQPISSQHSRWCQQVPGKFDVGLFRNLLQQEDTAKSFSNSWHALMQQKAKIKQWSMLIQPLNEIRLLISGKQGVFDWGRMIRVGKTASERDFLYGGFKFLWKFTSRPVITAIRTNCKIDTKKKSNRIVSKSHKFKRFLAQKIGSLRLYINPPNYVQIQTRPRSYLLVSHSGGLSFCKDINGAVRKKKRNTDVQWVTHRRYVT